MSSAEAEDSLLIVNVDMSGDKSFTHLADTSISPITLPPPGLVACSLMFLIYTGVGYDTGSAQAVVVHADPL